MALMGFLFVHDAERHRCASRSSHGPVHVADAVAGDIEELFPDLRILGLYII